MPLLGVGHQRPHQSKRRGIRPLQVVEEDHQRAVRSAEDGEEAAKRQREPVLRLCGTDFWRGPGVPDHEADLGQDRSDDCSACVQRAQHRGTPFGDAFRWLAEQLANQDAERRDETGVRDAA